jgi:uncharacterized BrkB/YihY/UPF0761 family membrane protein
LFGRFIGALALLGVGFIHLDEYRGSYGAIPTIGPLFLANFVASIVIAGALLMPLEHVSGRRSALVMLAVAGTGIALSAGSFVMLLISERGSLFGFHELGYDPSTIAASRAFELAAVVALGLALIARFVPRSRQRRW